MLIRLLLAGIVITGVASAQRGGGGVGGGLGGPQGGQDDGGYGALAARPFQQQSRLDRLTSMLKLNKEQKSGAKEIFDAAQKEAEPVREEIQQGRAALATAYLERKPQADIDQITAAYSKSLAQMTTIEMRAFAKLCESLDKDQQKKVGPVFQLMSGMFNGRDWNRI